jgi:hypothetical protein
VIRGDASEVYRLATDLSTVGFKMIPALRSAMDQAGREFAAEWARNAVETSGKHGKHYPKSINSDLVFSVRSVTVEAGPDKSKRQGSMGRGFEFGSENQPPHLDGLRALDAIAPAVEALAAAVVGGTFVAHTPTAATLQEYVTRAGNTRLATAAQIANWTRGSR